jgi:hypothetical protein
MDLVGGREFAKLLLQTSSGCCVLLQTDNSGGTWSGRQRHGPDGGGGGPGGTSADLTAEEEEEDERRRRLHSVVPVKEASPYSGAVAMVGRMGSRQHGPDGVGNGQGDGEMMTNG